MYYFWAVVVAVGLSSRFGGYLLSFRWPNHKRKQKWQALPRDEDENDAMDDPEISPRRSFFDTPYLWLERYVTVPATFGYKRSQNVGWCTIPTRVQSLAIAAFVLVNVVLCSCSYRVFENNI